MTITRDFNSWLLACDVCEEQPEGEDFETFDDAREFAKREGWTLRKTKSGEWENLCARCSKGVSR